MTMAPVGREAGALRPRLGLPFLGYGVGLRRPHFDAIFEQLDRIDFVEVLCENVMGFGGRPRSIVERVARELPVVIHGVALSIGSLDPLDDAYLDSLAELCASTEALWASDHLCFSSAFGVEYHDLIPLPFTREAVDHVVSRVRQVQARLPVPFALENPSYYIAFRDSELDEAAFLTAIAEEADCGLLLDVNNVYVNAQNHGYDARAFIDALPLHRVVQIHMAGHFDRGDVIIDTHGDRVIDEVLELFRYTISRTGPVATLFEWDNDIPPLDIVLAENDKVRAAGTSVHGEVAPWRR